MFNFKSIKFLPSEYVFKYKNGKIVKEGKGLSFIYYVPNTSVVVIPTSSADVPFIFHWTFVGLKFSQGISIVDIV